MNDLAGYVVDDDGLTSDWMHIPSGRIATSIDRIVGAIAAKGKQVFGGPVVVDLTDSGWSAQQLIEANIGNRVRSVTSSVGEIIFVGG